MSDLELVHLILLQNICQLTLNYSYLDAFQELILEGKLKEVSIIKERENFYPTLKNQRNFKQTIFRIFTDVLL